MINFCQESNPRVRVVLSRYISHFFVHFSVHLVQVFGTKKVLWFLPLFSEDDLKNISALHGLDFPTCPDMEE